VYVCVDICDDCCRTDEGTAFQAQAYNFIKDLDPYHVTVGASDCLDSWVFFDSPTCDKRSARPGDGPCPMVTADVSQPVIGFGAQPVTQLSIDYLLVENYGWGWVDHAGDGHWDLGTGNDGAYRNGAPFAAIANCPGANKGGAYFEQSWQKDWMLTQAWLAIVMGGMRDQLIFIDQGIMEVTTVAVQIAQQIHELAPSLRQEFGLPKLHLILSTLDGDCPRLNPDAVADMRPGGALRGEAFTERAREPGGFCAHIVVVNTAMSASVFQAHLGGPAWTRLTNKSKAAIAFRMFTLASIPKWGRSLNVSANGTVDADWIAPGQTQIYQVGCADPDSDWAPGGDPSAPALPGNLVHDGSMEAQATHAVPGWMLLGFAPNQPIPYNQDPRAMLVSDTAVAADGRHSLRVVVPTPESLVFGLSGGVGGGARYWSWPERVAGNSVLLRERRSYNVTMAVQASPVGTQVELMTGHWDTGLDGSGAAIYQGDPLATVTPGRAEWSWVRVVVAVPPATPTSNGTTLQLRVTPPRTARNFGATAWLDAVSVVELQALLDRQTVSRPLKHDDTTSSTILSTIPANFDLKLDDGGAMTIKVQATASLQMGGTALRMVSSTEGRASESEYSESRLIGSSAASEEQPQQQQQRCAAQPSAAALQAALDAAIRAGASTYVVPAAAVPYCFGNTSLRIEQAHGLEVFLGGNAFLFSVGAGVLVRDSTAITLRGGGADAPASISYDPPTAAQGVIESTWASGSGKTLFARVRLDPRFPTTVPLGAQCLLWGPGDELHPHFSSCKQVSCADGGPPGLCINTPQPGRHRYTNGTAVAFPLYRAGYTVDLVNASNCTVTDVHVLAASFMAITEFAGGGGNLYERVRVGWTPGQPYTPFVRNGLVPQPRLSSNADVFHSYGTRRGPRIVNCTFEMAADDFFNVHNENQVAFQRPNATAGGRVVYLIDPHLPVDEVGAEHGFRRPRTTYGTVSSMDYARVGDTLSFGSPVVTCQESGQGCKFGNWTSAGSSSIVSIRRTTDPAVLALAAIVYKNICDGQPCAGSLGSFVYAAEIDEPSAIDIPEQGCLANVDDMSAAGAVIENNVFRHSNANLGRTKSRNSLIRNNHFQNAAECHLDAVPLPMYLEGPWSIPGVLIENNTFADCPAGSIHHGAMAQVTAVGNKYGSGLKTDELVTVSSAWLAEGAAAGTIPLARARIVLPAAANCIELAAARELQLELAALSGSPPAPLLYEPQPPALTAIFVGRTAAMQRIVSLRAPLRPEEAVVAAAAGSLFVFGDDSNAPNVTTKGACSSYLGALPLCVGVMSHTCQAGTFFATSLLLREQLGMRWVWPGDDGIVRPAPDTALAVSSGLHLRSAPVLPLRRIRPNPAAGHLTQELFADLGGWGNLTLLQEYTTQESMWMLRNGLGGRDTVPWGQAFMSAWSEYGNAHPEWFALHRDGTRGCQHGSMCEKAPQLVKIDAAGSPGLVQHIASLYQPGTSGVSACEDDDNTGFCTCAKCSALDPPERRGSGTGSLSDRYTYFWNQVSRQLRADGHSDAWVGAYAYDNYTDPPLHQTFDNESKVLILSVGFGSVLDYDNSTVQSRSGWDGWVKAGAKGMAMRPNSPWSDYTGLPFVFSRNWLEDVRWCGQNSMLAADFDSLIGNWQGVGPSYYTLARTLWNPSTANFTAITQEFYSAYGVAATEMQAYHEFWRGFAQKTYTDPVVLARISAFATKGSPDYVGGDRAQYIMAGDIYSAAVLVHASTLLQKAQAACGATAVAPACVRVQKAVLHLAYTKLMAEAANATKVVFPRSGSEASVPATEIVRAGRALQKMAVAIADQRIVNVYLTLGKCNERGDLLGLLAAADAPPDSTGLTPLFMLPTQGWLMILDPTGIGVSKGWWKASGVSRKAWSRSSTGCITFGTFGGCGSQQLEAWQSAHNGSSYVGLSWWSIQGGSQGMPLFGNGSMASSRLYLPAPNNEQHPAPNNRTSMLRVWVNGVELGGCATVASCSRPVMLTLPRRVTNTSAASLVLAVNTSQPGEIRRIFTLKTDDGHLIDRGDGWALKSDEDDTWFKI
jgi:hypothetical protein